MDILYVVPGLGISGGINVVMEHANSLLSRGHDVTIASMGESVRIEWRENRCPIVPLRSVGASAALSTRTRDFVIFTGWQTAYASYLCNLPSRRYAYFVQSDEERFYETKSIEGLLAAASYQLDCDYLTEARWIQSWLATYGHDALYAPNGVDHRLFYPRKPIVPRSGRLRVLIEGPLAIDFKKVREAFTAVQDLDVEVWAVSSAGVLEPWMKPNMFFDAVPISRMPEIYSSCDVLLKLSRVEGFFGPPLEMMACGGTAITSDVTGHDEFMQDGFNGFVIPDGNPSLARARLEVLMGDQDLLERMKQNGVATAEQFQWPRTIDWVEEWLLGRLEHSPRHSWNALLNSHPRLASFEVCARAFAQTFPKSIAPFTFSDLHSEFHSTEVWYGVVLGWTWPGEVARIHIESASVLDYKITSQVRPDVAKSGCCPAGARPGFRAEILFTKTDSLAPGAQHGIVYEFKDGTHAEPGSMSAAGNAFIDSANFWRCWDLRFAAKETPAPESTFRLSFSGKSAAVALADPQSELSLTNLSWLENRAVFGDRFVTESDHFLLYHAAENLSAPLHLFCPDQATPELICAVRARE